MRLCIPPLMTLFVLASLSWPLAAGACESLKSRAEHYRDLRRAGGTARQLARWQSQYNHYWNRYQDCHRRGLSAQGVERVQGQAPLDANPQRWRRRQTEVTDPVVRSLLRTCNYWIDEYNQQPTEHARQYRASACRDFASAERRALNPPARLPAQHRPLSECAKPGNVLDNEVLECMQGLRQPSW
ncbi:hypothetical protein [Marinimicrobium alkaliphilum]|uniref:hypothetical protein n=1 Tax=Marinimicrobium alkaliphilum TaxID=2202654 RepID=UPI001300AF1C|nr:hypothetical protein [Marinimicrobium alkaliphilum]